MRKGRTTLTLAWTDCRLSYQKQNISLIRSPWTLIALWFCTLDLRSNVNVVDAYNTRTYHIHMRSNQLNQYYHQQSKLNNKLDKYKFA